uniref:CAZy families GH13 protein n=1 Tax=uncultured Xanthomonas sp. TaxID=152831 RepID=A0A060C609_9XANT|nr:CAZy families GH13 protein [uncultured Xanthomonas sp.]
MARMDASDNGFIDAHNWLFTARGIPVVYYGSETGFMRGGAEHAGNRNYYGQARIDTAPSSPIYRHLVRIASLRRATPALQRGLQSTWC